MPCKDLPDVLRGKLVLLGGPQSPVLVLAGWAGAEKGADPRGGTKSRGWLEEHPPFSTRWHSGECPTRNIESLVALSTTAPILRYLSVRGACLSRQWQQCSSWLPSLCLLSLGRPGWGYCCSIVCWLSLGLADSAAMLVCTPAHLGSVQYSGQGLYDYQSFCMTCWASGPGYGHWIVVDALILALYPAALWPACAYGPFSAVAAWSMRAYYLL